MSVVGSPRVHPLVRFLLLVVIFGGLISGFVWTVLRPGDSKPTITLERSDASPGDVMTMYIRIPRDVPGDGVADWIYGYTADFSHWTGERWEQTHTLFVAMDPEGDFGGTGYTREKNPTVFAIGFLGSQTTRIEIPPVAPGLYRVTMEFGYDATERRSEAIVHDTIEVAD